MTTHVDGDDYTWQAGPVQAGPVFIPDAQPGTAEAWAERWQRQAVRALGNLEGLAAREAGRYSLLDEMTELEPAWPGPAAGPDLRTLAERERDDVAALHSQLEQLGAFVQHMAAAQAALEATVAALAKVLEVRLP